MVLAYITCAIYVIYGRIFSPKILYTRNSILLKWRLMKETCIYCVMWVGTVQENTFCIISAFFCSFSIFRKAIHTAWPKRNEKKEKNATS